MKAKTEIFIRPKSELSLNILFWSTQLNVSISYIYQLHMTCKYANYIS